MSAAINPRIPELLRQEVRDALNGEVNLDDASWGEKLLHEAGTERFEDVLVRLNEAGFSGINIEGLRYLHEQCAESRERGMGNHQELVMLVMEAASRERPGDKMGIFEKVAFSSSSVLPVPIRGQ